MIASFQDDGIIMALQLRPNCEYCDKDLPPSATDARICSYECTFCADCVETKIFNVCPNCGGGFAPRPIRPAREWRPGVCPLCSSGCGLTVRVMPADVETTRNGEHGVVRLGVAKKFEGLPAANSRAMRVALLANIRPR